MASIYDLKPRFQALLRPLCSGLARAGVTANHVTVAAMALSAAGGAWIALAPASTAPLLALPVLLFIRMALNAIDGMLAREFGQKSDLGAILNELGDVLSDAFLYLPFALLPGLDATLVVLIVLLAVIVEMTGVVGVQIGASRRYDGPLGKSDRAFAFGLLAVLLAFGWLPAPWGTLYLGALLALSLYTLVNRARRALQEKAQAGSSGA